MHNSWEGVDRVHAPELIEEYFQRKQRAVQTAVLKGGQEASISTSPNSFPLPSPILINTTVLSSMDHAMPFQSHWATTPISEPGQLDWCANQHIRAGTWNNDSIWIYSNPLDMTMAEKHACYNLSLSPTLGHSPIIPLSIP